MAVASVYGDESESDRVFVLSIYLATVDDWTAFEARWIAVLEDAGLRQSNGALLPFHMADFESRKPPFDGWDNEKRVKVIRSLIRVIHETNTLSASIGLPLED